MSLTVVGHVAIDTLITPDGEAEQLGGPPSYMTAIGDLIGSQVDVVTRIGRDLPKAYCDVFKDRGVDLDPWTCESPTTRFILDYTTQPRGLGVGALCEEIKRDGIPDSGCVVISPIVGEIDERTLASINPDYLSLDTQGFVRNIHSDGSLNLEPWSPPDLRRVNLLKTSQTEHFYLTCERSPEKSLAKLVKKGVEVAVITLGEKGALIQRGETTLSIPAYRGRTVDATGAGDCFMASLSYSLFRDEALEWSCAFASAVASSIVETAGPYIEHTKATIHERAEQLHEKVLT